MKNYLPMILVVGAVMLLLFVIGCRTPQATTATPPPAVATAPAPTAEKVTIAADEASCPVLGTVAKKSDMIPATYKGKTYYMCCSGCVPKFKANPEKYIQHPAPPTREMSM